MGPQTGLELTIDALAAALLVVALPLSGLVVRRRLLQRGGGTIDCSLRESTAAHGKGWTLGVARYAGDELQWYRVFSASPRPKRVLARGELAVRGRRRPSGVELFALPAGAVVVQCARTARSGGRRRSRQQDRGGHGPSDRPGAPGATVEVGVVELGMAEDALTGFLAWLEAAPPGRGAQVANA